jgi:hypothetical protein
VSEFAGVVPTAPAGWGYVESPVGSGTDYQGNSTGALNTVDNLGDGLYEVTFPRLASAGMDSGTVDVSTAEGSNPGGFCDAGSWGPSGTSVLVLVNCYTESGQASANPNFDVVYGDPPGRNPPSQLTYVLANEPTTANYTPNQAYQYNSTFNVDTITRVSTGDYEVYAPGLTLSDGTVTVTGVGGAYECQVGDWFGDQVNVLCFTAAGTPADSQFTMTWTAGESLLGVSGRKFGYLWASQPEATSAYSPPPSYSDDAATGGTITITPVTTGLWAVTITKVGAANAGDVEVSAYGTTFAQCTMGFYDNAATVFASVECFAANGQPVDTYFTLQYQR